MLTDEEAAAIEEKIDPDGPAVLLSERDRIELFRDAAHALLADRRERIEREARLEAWAADARYWFRSVAEPGGNGITRLRAETLLADPAGQAAEARVAERVRAAVEAEREAIARSFEDSAPDGFAGDTPMLRDFGLRVAAAIRARGQGGSDGNG